MDAREQKARDLADRALITCENGIWRVPSQSGSGFYYVIIDDKEAICDCPDFELRDKPCKHIKAVRIRIKREKQGIEPDTKKKEPSPKVKRKTYPQNWTSYNGAKVNEHRHFPVLLADLCRNIIEPPHEGRGRKPIPLADQAFAAVMKVYSKDGARVFSPDLDDGVEHGHIQQSMHFNTILNAIIDERLTPVLNDMIRRSALPLRAVETDFAPDSTGFCTSRYTKWHDVKTGVTKKEADWVKAHLMTGVKTNIVTAVVILDKNAADGPQFPKLIEDTARNFTIIEVSADKAYCSSDAFDLVDKLGGTLYAAFKSNATGGVGGVYEKMFHYFCLRREDFLNHYHKRSNVESTVAMVKALFGEKVRSKTDTAMKNEVLAKFVCHNICCLISAMYELGIAPKLAGEESREILPFRKQV